VIKQNEQAKSAEERITKELGNQARQEPGSREEDEAKERRAEAEKDAQRAKES
jgi:hypothetical protein